MAEPNLSPRVLTISFQFHVPQGLKANIRTARIDTAIARIIGSVQGIAPSVFPWADKIVAQATWDYRWRDQTEVLTLEPPFETNDRD